jgi:hypothetical protein
MIGNIILLGLGALFLLFLWKAHKQSKEISSGKSKKLSLEESFS